MLRNEVSFSLSLSLFSPSLSLSRSTMLALQNAFSSSCSFLLVLLVYGSDDVGLVGMVMVVLTGHH